jgi:hypothetical protein
MKWEYEVWVGTISGEVEADNEEDAMVAADEHANAQARDRIDGGTWRLHEVEGDG